MRVATLQYSPQLGALSDNIARADKILRSSLPPPSSTAFTSTAATGSSSTAAAPPIDLLILPELAFTGYNFASLSAIRAYLEPTAAGPSTQWAQRVAREYACVVAVGYPERFTHHPGGAAVRSNGTGTSAAVRALPSLTLEAGAGTNGHAAPETESESEVVAYNSLVTVSPAGAILAHYRKSHLYYTDETWARESPQGFVTTELALPLPRSTAAATASAEPETETAKIAWAICMDINPYRFLPHHYPLYEYATHARAHGADTCVLSTAWLTSLLAADLASAPAEPDWQTFSYWIDRLTPLVLADASLPEAGKEGEEATTAAKPVSSSSSSRNRMTTVICANRAGSEPGVNPCGQPDEGVRYAGTSWIGRVGGDRVEVWGMLGRGEEGVLRVDFSEGEAEKVFVLKRKDDDDHNDDEDEDKQDAID